MSDLAAGYRTGVHETELLQLGFLVGGGVLIQVLAVRLRIPSIIGLLAAGFVAGPVLGWLDPDHLFGDLLFPFVSLAVGLILFEGGIELDGIALRRRWRSLSGLVLVGGAVTGVVVATAAVVLVGTSVEIGAVIGAICVVSGPTVVGPLLDQIAAEDDLDALARAEGIIVDPVGAIAAVLVTQVVIARSVGDPAIEIVGQAALTLAVGGGLGLVGAVAAIVVLRRRWVADQMRAPLVLGLVVGSVAVGNALAAESGLVAATLLGAVLGTRHRLDLRAVEDATATLRVLLLGVVFMVLAARVDGDDVLSSLDDGLILTAVLVLVARPLAVAVGGFGTGLDAKERLVLATIASRGIVAAAVASVFAVELAEVGVPGTEDIAPIVAVVIVGTIVWTSVVTPAVARRLGLAEAEPRHVVLVGPSPLLEPLAEALEAADVPTIVVEPSRRSALRLRRQGLSSVGGEPADPEVRRQLPWWRVRWVLVLDAEPSGVLAADEFRAHVESDRVVLLAPDSVEERVPEHLDVARLFGPDVDLGELTCRAERSGAVRTTPLTEEFDLDALRAEHGEDTILLMALDAEGRADPVTSGEVPGGTTRVLHLPAVEAEPARGQASTHP